MGHRGCWLFRGSLSGPARSGQCCPSSFSSLFLSIWSCWWPSCGMWWRSTLTRKCWRWLPGHCLLFAARNLPFTVGWILPAAALWTTLLTNSSMRLLNCSRYQELGWRGTEGSWVELCVQEWRSQQGTIILVGCLGPSRAGPDGSSSMIWPSRAVLMFLSLSLSLPDFCFFLFSPHLWRKRSLTAWLPLSGALLSSTGEYEVVEGDLSSHCQFPDHAALCPGSVPS